VGRFYETRFGVYFDDLDSFQILHNSRYLLLFERCIGEFWERMGWGGLLDAQLNPDQFHLVRKNQIEYLRPVRGVGQVRVRLQVARIGDTSVTFSFRVMPMDQDVDFAIGERVIVKVDPNTHRPAPWSEEFRRRLSPFLATAAAQ
jgi:acyl-CoA thioester hydrolase